MAVTSNILPRRGVRCIRLVALLFIWTIDLSLRGLSRPGQRAGGRADVAGQGLGWQRSRAVACRAVEHMTEDLLGMTSESNGSGGDFEV